MYWYVRIHPRERAETDKGDNMALKVGTIVKWYDRAEECESREGGMPDRLRVCTGIIRKVDAVPTRGMPDKVVFTVEWWQQCPLHAVIDQNGSGPYETDSLWEIGLLY